VQRQLKITLFECLDDSVLEYVVHIVVAVEKSP